MRFWVNGKVGMYASAVSISGPTSASALSVGSRFCRFVTRSAWVSLTRPETVSLSVPSFSSAVVSLGRSLIRTSNAGGILFSARVSTSCWLPSVDANRFSSSMVAMMLSRC